MQLATMERDEETAEATAAKRERKGRTWTERYPPGPVVYRRASGTRDGKPRIFFSVELPPGQPELEQAVNGIFREAKSLVHGPEHTPGVTQSGVKKDRRGEWSMPNTPIGRTAADKIDWELSQLAERMERPPSGPGR